MSAFNAGVDEAGVLLPDVGGLIGGIAAAMLGLSRGATIATFGVRVLTAAIKSLLLPLGLVALVTAPFMAFSNAAESLDAASKSASRLGMSVSTFQTLSQVADEAGVSVEQMTGMMTRLGIRVTEASRGNKAAQDSLSRLGLTFAQLQGQSPQRQFEMISQRIMALPTAAERSAAAVAVFGKSGAQAMGLIAAASTGAISQVEKLRNSLGVNMTDQQTAGIEIMNDALSRLSLPLQGFINQFVAELAPAITTVSRLFVQFFAENTSGFSMASALAAGLTQTLRIVVGAVTLLTGLVQVLSAGFGLMVSGAMGGFGLLLTGLAAVQEGIAVLLDAFGTVAKAIIDTLMVPITALMDTIASAADAVGFTSIADDLREAADVAEGMTSGLENLGDTVRGDFLSSAADSVFAEADIWGQAAASQFAQGVENMANPFAAFDAEFANAQREASEAAAKNIAQTGPTAAKAVSDAVKVSMQELKALVAGTSGGESFRNSILRGSDPRLSGDAPAKETADNTERTADGVEDLPDALAASLGQQFGLASLMA
jgi:hypothetical protein